MSRVPRKRYKTQDVLKMLLAESSDDDIDASDNEVQTVVTIVFHRLRKATLKKMSLHRLNILIVRLM